MGDLIDKAVEALRALPVADRDRIAWEILERVEDKTEWDRVVASPASQAWLREAAEKALAEYARIMKTLSHTHISISQDNLLREDPYWQHFDDLPQDIKKMAETNYRLFKDNPKDPALRFKKIHPSCPSVRSASACATAPSASRPAMVRRSGSGLGRSTISKRPSLKTEPDYPLVNRYPRNPSDGLQWRRLSPTLAEICRWLTPNAC